MSMTVPGGQLALAQAISAVLSSSTQDEDKTTKSSARDTYLMRLHWTRSAEILTIRRVLIDVTASNTRAGPEATSSVPAFNSEHFEYAVASRWQGIVGQTVLLAEA